jgi:hypothetical protein
MIPFSVKCKMQPRLAADPADLHEGGPTTPIEKPTDSLVNGGVKRTEPTEILPLPPPTALKDAARQQTL